MSRVTIPDALRAEVRERAKGFCEYCLLSESDSVLSHEVDHVIAVQHRGPTSASNLALSCFECNRRKGTNIGSLDPADGRLVSLFNPRTQNWNDHFLHEGARIVPLTAEARVTAELLQFNSEARIRRRLLAIG